VTRRADPPSGVRGLLQDHVGRAEHAVAAARPSPRILLRGHPAHLGVGARGAQRIEDLQPRLLPTEKVGAPVRLTRPSCSTARHTRVATGPAPKPLRHLLILTQAETQAIEPAPSPATSSWSPPRTGADEATKSRYQRPRHWSGCFPDAQTHLRSLSVAQPAPETGHSLRQSARQRHGLQAANPSRT
jgi:hypothetical protein